MFNEPIQFSEYLHAPSNCSSGDKKYVLKTVAPHDFNYFEKMFDDLRSSPYIRVSADSCPEESLFVYNYLPHHFLGFVQKGVSLPITKRILRDALRSIQALHEKGIVHTDIKPNNILIKSTQLDQDTDVVIKKVKIADNEDAAYVPEGCILSGRQFGNWMWRSPEAHASANLHTPSDMFSFGLVVSSLCT